MSQSSNDLISLKDLAEQASLSRLSTLSRRNDLQLQESQSDQIVYGNWMTLVLVNGKAVRILFKAHFSTNAARYLAGISYGGIAHVSTERAIDFCKEFCNLTAGQIKEMLGRNSYLVGVSLPILANGFDEIYFSSLSSTINHIWKISFPEDEITCSIDFDIYENLVLSKKNMVSADDGDVDFL